MICVCRWEDVPSPTPNTLRILGVQELRYRCRSGAQHSSSASLMGGIKLLEDLYWLTWLTARVFTGLICMVLRWVFSGSSVNHVFSEKKPKSHRDKEEGREIVNATWTSITLSGFACVLVHTEYWEDIIYFKINNCFCRKNFWHDKKYARRCFLMAGKYQSMSHCPSFHLCYVTHLMFFIYTILPSTHAVLLGQQTCRSPVKQNLFSYFTVPN